MGRYLIRIPVADPAVLCRSLVVFLSLIILLSKFLRVRVIWPLHSWWEDIPSVTVRLLLVSMSCCQCSDLCVTPYVPTCSSAFATHTLLILLLPRATGADRLLYLALSTPTCKTRRRIPLFCTIGYGMQVQDDSDHVGCGDVLLGWLRNQIRTFAGVLS